MNKKSWTQEELDYIVNNYSFCSAKDLAKHLGRSDSSVISKISKMGLNKRTTWTIEEDAFLAEYYSLNGISYCSKALGRTEYAISNRIRKLGLFSLTTDIKSKNILKDWLDTNKDIEIIGNFTNVLTKVEVKHTSCGYSWYTTIDTLKASRKKGYLGCPNCSRTKAYSNLAIEWLRTFNNPNIQHAENGGEVTFGNYRVDGYDPTTNTIYEFHGDVFHGNLDLFHPDFRCHPFDKTKTAEELWDKTYDRMLELSKVATVIYIWENDYKRGKSYEVF